MYAVKIEFVNFKLKLLLALILVIAVKKKLSM